MPTPPHCPRCSVALTFEDCDGVEIDVCPTCRGVFLDKGELTKIGKVELARRRRGDKSASPSPALASPPADAAAARHDPEVACPRCSKPMRRERRGVRDQVALDICKAHGMWLDAGELARVIEDVSEAERRMGIASKLEAGEPSRATGSEPSTGKLAGLLRAGRLGFIVEPSERQ